MIQTSLFEQDRGAVFSDDRLHRYTLWRRWGNKGDCLFIMLNPSTADEEKNDPTVERCERFARSWGFTGLVVCNLFALRATDPREMLSHDNPIGDQNDNHILMNAKAAERVICAWGNDGSHIGRSTAVRENLKAAQVQTYVLHLNQTGEPSHPLYLSKSLKPFLWE